MPNPQPRTGVIAGAGVPHAPQFWAMPDTEDQSQVARIRDAMAAIGRDLIALDPDVVIVVANDHTENYFHACVPAFTLHAGTSPGGTFAERTFSCTGAPSMALDLVEMLQHAGFDPAFSQYAILSYAFGIPLDFCGIPSQTPVLPLFVNAYVPPQPLPERCFALGEAIDRACREKGIRAVMIASGGMSHFPGTDRYESPDVATDEALLSALKKGRTREMLAFDLRDLDETGNLELLPWVVLGGAVGQRTPDTWAFEASWHHTYTVVGWTDEASTPHADRHSRVYPGIHPDLQRASAALYELRYDKNDAVRRFLNDAEGFARSHAVEPHVLTDLLGLDDVSLRAAGLHPFLVSGAIRSVERARNAQVEHA